MRQATPRNDDPNIATVPFLDFSSGYVTRSSARFPKQGAKAPWKLHMNYAIDAFEIRYGKLEDGALQLSNPVVASASVTPERVAA